MNSRLSRMLSQAEKQIKNRLKNKLRTKFQLDPKLRTKFQLDPKPSTNVFFWKNEKKSVSLLPEILSQGTSQTSFFIKTKKSISLPKP